MEYKRNYLKIKNKIHDLFQKKQNFDPQQDWKIIFLISTLLFFGALISHGYFFFKVNKGDLFKVEVEMVDKNPKVNEKELNMTLEYFNKKKARFEEIQKNGLGSFDPAL